MLATRPQRSDGPLPVKAPESEAAAARWENEGGTGAPTVGAAPNPAIERRAGWDDPTPRQVIALDLRQDELMAAASPDGNPPTHRQRRLGWWWLAIGASVLIVAGIAWAAIRGVDMTAVLAASGLALVLLGSAAPVWGAGLLRGREERSARRKARLELRANPSRPRTPQPGPA